MAVRIKRVYHHYLTWEDYIHGMWRIVDADEERMFLQRAIEFTGDAKLYGSFMRRVIVEWPIACEQNLTNPGMNQLAWVGHAACCMAINCPEYITRQAWGRLTQQQRDDANLEARQAVSEWVLRYHCPDQMLLSFVAGAA